MEAKPTQFDITTFGEVMLRLSVPAGVRMETMQMLNAAPGGAESNISSLLSRLGYRTAYITRMPDNPLGRFIANQMRAAGVDLKKTIWTRDGRLGTYFVEFTVPPRPIQVVYDRADSSFSRVQSSEIDWDYLLDTRLLHVTGITPALSPQCLETTQEAIQRARKAGTPISFDVNYRGKLWSYEQAAEALQPLILGCELLFCKLTDAEKLFGLHGEPEFILRQLVNLVKPSIAVLTMGERGVLGWMKGHLLYENAVPTTIIDRLGAGDALAAGVIRGWLDGNIRKGLRYGVILAALALSQYTDMVITTPAELEQLAQAAGEDVLR